MKKVVIYSQEGCSHCAELKNLLEQNGIPYMTSDIDNKKEDWTYLATEMNRNKLTLTTNEFSAILEVELIML